MTQKTISLNEKAYKKLKNKKEEKESFSELIIRLCEIEEINQNENLLLKFSGAFKENSDYWKTIEEYIDKERNYHLSSEEDT